MKKRTIILLGAGAALALFIVLGLPPLMRLLFGRSQQATMLLWQFRKERYTTEEAFEAYLDEKRGEDAVAYVPPVDTPEDLSLERLLSQDMPYFVVNEAGADERLVVYFAGGSYIDRPTQSHWQFIFDLARDTGCAVAVPIYPKLPDADASESYAALTGFCDTLESLRGGGELIFMGDSAGGGMALSLAMQLRDAGRPGPDKLILICPWLDVTLENPSVPAYEARDPALDAEQLRHLGALWAGGLSPYDPVVSPLYGHCDGLGKIVLVTTTGELLYPDIARLDAVLSVAGVEHMTIVREDLFHIWPIYEALRIPESQETYAALLDIVTG